MEKKFKILFLIVVAIVLSACSKGESVTPLTAKDIFQKAEKATANLKSVRTHVTYDTSSDFSETEERTAIKYTVDTETQLDPAKWRQHLIIQPRNADLWEADVFHVNDLTMVKDQRDGTLELFPSESTAEWYHRFIMDTSSVMDLTLLEPFVDEFELAPIDYGYALTISMKPEQYKRFMEHQYKRTHGNDAEFDPETLGFPIVEKFEMELKINKETFFVTSFKLTTDVTNYYGHHSIRTKQKLNAVYSYFNDVNPVKLPQEVLDAASK